MYVNRFDTDDTYSRIDTFPRMFGALLLALSAGSAFKRLYFIVYRKTFNIVHSLLEGLSKISSMPKIACSIPEGFNAGVAFWIISLFFPVPIKFILWELAH
ncbi:MAG: hypothetical protein COT91_01430 [Candidatus Doudnabacteria bacterium CG10_big_fil_rev_8_21_14_0_10_41_10]|uniref:Uncharacterized protein n=1 Tax=Candidatus Doudnabacteria bacterium CG10_big_fil_rev_8_21_14_0_10_41_10 TaxID=1974551 RepID=A0A2H0VGG4_9BACT|nr:MAG: hypothetical protein COT91_01430 [Candidatus Doudnabacteria bacterium CG10_big_fil_rev_8_21_14_0_10_41_10]